VLLLFSGCIKDKCNDVKCLNGGTCNDGTCACPEGWEGVNCETEKTQQSNFDKTKGWKLVQTVEVVDRMLGISGSADIYYYDMDFKNNNLRVMSYQRRKSQQDYNYVNTRVDEYDASGNVVKRDMLEWPFEHQIENRPVHFMLRNGSPILIKNKQGETPGGSKWQVFDNGVFISESNETWGEYQGRLTLVDNNSIYFCSGTNDPNNQYCSFFVKRFSGSTWEYWKNGTYKRLNSAVLGAEIINNKKYAFMGNYLNADSTIIAVLSLNDSTQKWDLEFEQRIAGNFDYMANGIYGNISSVKSPVYFSNNGNPVLVIVNSLENNLFKINCIKINIENKNVSTLANISISSKLYSTSFVLLNEEVYLGYRPQVNGTAGPNTVVKLSGNNPIGVGLPGLTTKSSDIFLAVRNNKLYAITSCVCTYGELYVATPE